MKSVAIHKDSQIHQARFEGGIEYYGGRGKVATEAAQAQAIAGRAEGTLGTGAKRGLGKAEPNTNIASVFRDTLGQGDGPDDATASSSTSDVPSGEADSTPTAGVTVHVCGYCEKRSHSPGKLARHERVHAGGARDKLPFYCLFCPKQFGYLSQATEHKRSHTGEKPYACSMCPRRFANKGAVAPHERTDTGEKPYACSVCPKRFSVKSNVATHERTTRT